MQNVCKYIKFNSVFIWLNDKKTQLLDVRPDCVYVQLSHLKDVYPCMGLFVVLCLYALCLLLIYENKK